MKTKEGRKKREKEKKIGVRRGITRNGPNTLSPTPHKRCGFSILGCGNSTTLNLMLVLKSLVSE